MNVGFVAQVFATIGGLAGVAALLKWLNTRWAQRRSASGQAGVEYDKFVGAALARANEVNDGLRADLSLERRIKRDIINVFFDLVKAFRAKGATAEEVDPFLDRLDTIRADR